MCLHICHHREPIRFLPSSLPPDSPVDWLSQQPMSLHQRCPSTDGDQTDKIQSKRWEDKWTDMLEGQVICTQIWFFHHLHVLHVHSVMSSFFPSNTAVLVHVSYVTVELSGPEEEVSLLLRRTFIRRQNLNRRSRSSWGEPSYANRTWTGGLYPPVSKDNQKRRSSCSLRGPFLLQTEPGSVAPPALMRNWSWTWTFRFLVCLIIDRHLDILSGSLLHPCWLKWNAFWDTVWSGQSELEWAAALDSRRLISDQLFSLSRIHEIYMMWAALTQYLCYPACTASCTCSSPLTTSRDLIFSLKRKLICSCWRVRFLCFDGDRQWEGQLLISDEGERPSSLQHHTLSSTSQPVATLMCTLMLEHFERNLKFFTLKWKLKKQKLNVGFVLAVHLPKWVQFGGLCVTVALPVSPTSRFHSSRNANCVKCEWIQYTVICKCFSTYIQLTK